MQQIYMNKKIIDQKKSKSLSGEEVLSLCDNKAELYTYPDLVKFDDINELLGKWGACIILYLTREDYGHWVCLYKQDKKTLCFFDSYALMPDDELNFAPINFRKTHDQMYPHLTYLMYKSGYNIDYNNHRLQSNKKDTSTCGRWVGVRLAFRFMNNDEFADLFKNNEISPDELVTALTAFL